MLTSLLPGNALLLLKVLAVIHGLPGYIGFGAMLSPEAQAEFLYKDRNWLAADVKKYLLFGMFLCLALCGFAPWFKPVATPFLAWGALGFHVLNKLLDVATRGWVVECWRCLAVGVAIRGGGAVALMYFVSAYLSASTSGNSVRSAGLDQPLTTSFTVSGDVMAAELQAIQIHLWVITAVLVLILLATAYCNLSRMMSDKTDSSYKDMNDLWETERFAELRDATTQYLKSRPNTPWALSLHALVSLHFRDYAEARRAAEKLATSAPSMREMSSLLPKAIDEGEGEGEGGGADAQA